MKQVFAVVLGIMAGGLALLAVASDPTSPNPEEAYKDVRGYIVYKTHCVLCHGIDADGRGRAAKYYNPKPADLRHSDKTDQYKEMIIRNGGAAMGRSQFMPPWGQELTDEQIRDVVYYLGVINVASKTTSSKK